MSLFDYTKSKEDYQMVQEKGKYCMDNKIPKASADGKDRDNDKRTDTEDMPDKRCGDPGRVCRKGSHTSAGICAPTSISKQAGPVYEGEHVPKTTDEI